MRYLAAALVLLMPLALAPGWSFYYDITPKACLLYVGAAALAASRRGASATVHPNPPGIKIATSFKANPTDDDLLFLQQIGVEYVSLPATPETANAESFTKMRERYEAGGIKVYNIGSGVGLSVRN